MNQYSNSASRQIISILGQGVGWARDCVVSFVDDVATMLDRKPRDSALVFVGDKQSELYRTDRSGAQVFLAALPGSPADALADVRGKLGRKLQKAVRLRIASSRAVLKQIVLPASTQDVLPAIVRNKVEGLAPWPLHQAIWGHRVLQAAEGTGSIGVGVGILSRVFVETAVGQLSQAGMTINAVDIGNSPDDEEAVSLDLKSGQRSRKARKVASAVFSSVAVLAVGVSLYGAYLAFTAQGELAVIEQRTNILRQSIAGKGQATEAPAKIAEANRLYQRKQKLPPLVVVLNAVTDLLPDDVWLSQLNYTAGKVTVAGRGSNIPKLIETLEQSNFFRDANFASATQRDEEGQSDRFAISAVVETREPVQ